MPDRILITTADLEPAVRLKHAFDESDYQVELLTPGEHIREVPDPCLLVLTGGFHEKAAKRLAGEARELNLPVVALVEPGEKSPRDLQWQLGVSEVFQKPVEPADVVVAAKRLIERRQLRTITGIVGETEGMREALERVVQMAAVNSTVLITGESGTGKERIARGLHSLSPRKHRPFIAANVAALPETLLESELFGHEKGSFTGAVGQRKGFFELANRGTLFLDEIGEMPPATQSKLLRVLEEREFMRVGGESPIKVDVRVVAATNQNLRYLVEANRFRRDLYYRLNVLHIDLPPLRERREDIPLLVESFIRESSREHDRPGVAIAPDAMAILMEYSWPGNVRELKNLIESMVVLSPGRVITAADIPPEIRDASHGSRLLPVHVPISDASGSGAPPELEFIFRTLLQLRIDVDDLRRQFDVYKQSHPELPAHMPPTFQPYAPPVLSVGRGPIEDAVVHESTDHATTRDEDDEHSVVVFRPGVTMQDMEKEAITAALKEVAGNRRRAAQMLGMGERTLYRKIKEYGIPL
jgi:DNA-binding NtrC family response regulator